jgi:hypothetical protein
MGGSNMNYYGGLMSSIATGGRYGEISGGGYKPDGNYKSLEDYGNGVFSDAKEKLIRSIAKDVCKSLKVTASFADSAPIEKVIAEFAKIVPDPRNNKKIKTNSKMHSDICLNLAKAINKTYKAQIIDENDRSETICQKVSELLYTLFTGLHSEFLTVSVDISRIMSNLNVLQSYIDDLNQRLIKDLDAVSSTESGILKDSYAALSMELKRQHSYLANLTSGVVDPTKKSLIDLVEKNSEFKGLVKDLSRSVGSREFSDKLSFVLNGSYGVSQSAAIVNKALKKLGMSVSEYKNTKNLTELRNKLYNKMIGMKPSTKNISELVSAIDIITRSDLSHDDIADYLSKKGGQIRGGGEVDDLDGFSFGAVSVEDMMYSESENVFSNRRHASKRSIENTIKGKDRTKKKLFTLLNNQIKSCYNKITMELSKIAKKMGNDIKINDSIHTFMRQLSYFNGVQPDRKNIHKALSGYRLDAKSQYIKHDFITSLYTLSDAANECAKGTGSSNFRDLSKSLDDLIELIDGFNKNITNSLSDVHVDADREKMGGGTCNGASSYNLSVYGGFIGALTKGGLTSGGSGMGSFNNVSYSAGISAINGMEMTFGGNDGGSDDNRDYGGYETIGGQIANIVAGGDQSDYAYLSSVKKSIREIEYYYRISNIKSGLSIAASQQKNYTEDYENILGEECGILIDKINQKYQWLTCTDTGIQQNDRETVDRVGSTSMCVLYTKMRTVYTDADDFKNAWDGTVFTLEYIRSAKVEMIEASQALDLYLSKFTENIQNNPDSVKNFLHLLNNLEVVAKWFTNKSGDNLVNVFEAGGRTDKGAVKPTPDFTDHYYKTLVAKAPNGLVGINLSVENVKKFIILIEKSFKSMRALENIILTFSKIHDSNKALMSPGLMFKSFMKYAVASCIGLGIDSGTKVNSILDLDLRNLKLYLRQVDDKRNVFDPLTIGDISTYDFKRNDADDTNIYKNQDNNFLQTEEIYKMSIKSLVSKVFVVVGAYSLFNRPPKSIDNNNGFSNRPLRQIMGGSSHTEVMPDAVELYIRLLLLAEWYRELFKFKDGGDYNESVGITFKNKDAVGSTDKIISMIPAFDGIWSKFIKSVFIDGMHISDGNYTEHTSSDIISSINDIYRHYKPKYGSNCCMKILENFVGEINLRYGMIKRTEIDKYLDEKSKGLVNNEYDDNDLDDDSYNLLDYNETFDSNKIPSRKFQKISKFGNRGTALRNKNFIEEMKKFRKNVEDNLKNDSDFKNNSETEFSELSVNYNGLDDIIRNVKKRIVTSEKNSHFKILHSAIMGAEKFSNIDVDVMLLFHETVINPLTILYSTYKIVNDWNGFINVFNCGETVTDASTIADVKKQCWANLEKKTTGEYNKKQHLYFSNLLDSKDATTSSVDVLMKTLLQKIMYMVCDKNPMFEVRFSGDGKNRYPMISFNKLEECVEKLVTCVEKALQKFRKILPPGIIEKYEKNTASFTITNGADGSNENVNSLYYIKEHLCDRIIKDKYKLGLSSGNHALKNIWLYLTNTNNQSVHETGIFNLLYWTKQNQTTTFGTPVNTIEKRGLEENYTRFPINRIGIHAPNTFTGDSISLIGKVMMENSTTTTLRSTHPLILPLGGSDKITDIMKNKHMGYHGIYDYTEYEDDGKKWGEDKLESGSFDTKGLILKFNNLLYNYIQMFTEKQSTKIYLPLLQQFSNALSSEVMQENGLDDTKQNTSTNGPKLLEFDKITKDMGTYILCKTMGAAIRSIVTNKKNTSSVSILTFAEDNLVNVPEYMKDTMIAYLPIYDKHLNIISSQAEFIKTCLESSKITINDETPSSNKGIFINVCDNLIRGCRALQTCINSVSTELSDIPLYFETYKNSIADYKNRNGHLPFMPLSHASHLLNNQIRLADDNPNGIAADTDYTPIMGGGGNKFGGAGNHTDAELEILKTKKDNDFNLFNAAATVDDIERLGYTYAKSNNDYLTTKRSILLDKIKKLKS